MIVGVLKLALVLLMG